MTAVLTGTPSTLSRWTPKPVEQHERHIHGRGPRRTLQQAYEPGGQYSSNVQQRPHCLMRSASSGSVLARANNGTNGHRAEFGTLSSSGNPQSLAATKTYEDLFGTWPWPEIRYERLPNLCPQTLPCSDGPDVGKQISEAAPKLTSGWSRSKQSN